MEQTEENIARNLINRAKVLYNFFERLKYERETNPEALMLELAHQYALSQEQIQEFQKVTTRTSRARDIVRYLEDRFGLNEQGFIEDVKGLYSILQRNKKVPKENLQIRSHNLALAVIRNRWNFRDVAGFTKDHYFDQLDLPVAETIARLKRGLKTNVECLTFFVPSAEIYERKLYSKKWGYKFSAREIILGAIFGGEHPRGEAMQRGIANHELRHIFDRLIKTDTGYVETQAYLYEKSSLRGLEIDLERKDENIIQRMTSRKKSLDALRELKAPSFIIENAERLYEEAIEMQKEREKIKPQKDSIIASLVDLPIKDPATLRMLSYIFSIDEEEQIPYHLRLIKKFYKKE